MKKLLIVAIILCSLNVVSSAQDTLQNAIAIRVKQDYECWNKCDDGYPHLDKMMVTIGGTETKDSAGIIKKIDDKHYSAIFTKILEKEDFTYIAVKDETRGFGRKHNTFTYTDTINCDDLHLGENKNIRYYSDAVKCSCCHREGYSITTSVIIDRAIDVKIAKDSLILTVEEGELELTFSKFYNSGKNIELQYMCNNATNKSWMRVARQPYITSGGKVKLRYEDIVGEYSDSNERYKNCIGKYIDFRVVKTLLDGTKTYGEIVKARFYHKGPEFEIADIRRPFCEDINPLQIRVKFGNDVRDFSKMANLPGYEWIINDSTYTFMLNRCGDPDVEGYRVLNGVQSSGSVSIASSLSEYLKEPIIGKDWTIKLQYKPEGKEDDTMMPVSKNFYLPPKLDSIKAWQSEDYLFELDGKKYHLYNKNEPYVVLKITDNDTIGPGRMPYKIYNKKDSLLAEITGKIKVDEEKIRAEFEKEYNYDSLITKWVEEWYDKNQGKDDLRLFSGSTINLGSGNKGGRPICVAWNGDYTYITSDLKHLYKINGKLGNYGYEYYYETPNDSYYIENDDKGNYVLFHNGSVIVSPSEIEEYELVADNARYIILKKDNNFYLYDLTTDTPIQFKAVDAKFKSDVTNKNDLFVYDYHIISLKGNNINYYKISSNYTESKLEFEKLVTTLKKPSSASNILIGENSVSYTAQGENSYEEFYSTVSKPTFVEMFKAGRTLFSASIFEERYKRLWQQYYLQHYGYHIHGIKINQDDELILKDNDGCSYTIHYRVNVLDNFNITENVDKSEGKATLKVQPGGSTDYYYNGEKISGETEINLSNLHWGNNVVEFTDENGDVRYTHIVSLLPNVTFTTTPQTCSSPNGEISPNGKDAKECTSWQTKNPSMPDSDEYWNDGLGNLKAGTYAVRGKFGDLWVNFGKQTIANEVFSVEVSNVKDATEIGGTGSVELKIENQTKDITWTDTDTQATYTDYKQAIFTARKYNWTATPSLDECEVHVSFEIKAPKVELVNASVIYNADTKEAHVHVEGKKNDLVSSYQFTINDLAFYNDTVIENVDAETELYLGLSYKTTDDNNKNKEICIVRPTTTFAPSAMPDEDNATRCPSELGVINVTNCDYVNCEYSIDNGNFQQLSNIKNIEAVDGRHSITFRLHSTEQTDLGNIALYTTHEIDSIDIEPAQLPIITTSYTDVTCFGADDGEIFIIDTQNIRGNAQLSLDGEVWLEDAITNLAPGVYSIYQRDNFCPADTIKMQYNIASPNTPLQIATTAISHPSCNAIDGEISVRVSGGWSEMYKVLSDTLITNEILEDEAGYSDEVQYTFGNLCGGTHTIYVADANGCYVSVDTKLNDHAPGVAYELSVTDASCFDFVDGSLSLMNIQGFSSANCTLTKAGNIIWQGDIDVDFDTVAIHSALRAGNDYNVILRNDAGCIGSDRFYVNQPPKIELDLGPDITICPNNTVTLDAGNYNEFCWQRDGNELSSQQQITVDKSGKYGVEITDSYGCHASDEVNIEVGNSALQANFLMASDVALNDTVVLIELSNMQPDNIEWLYPDTAFDDVTPADAEYYLLYLCPKVKGTFKIEMKAYANGCESVDTKQIMVLSEVEDTSDFKIGYDPLIKQAKVNPNPNNGEFELVVKLREVADIDVTIADVDSGQKVEHIVLKGSDSYNSRLNIKQWGSGIFVLSIISGEERRAIKVLCVR